MENTESKTPKKSSTTASKTTQTKTTASKTATTSKSPSSAKTSAASKPTAAKTTANKSVASGAASTNSTIASTAKTATASKVAPKSTKIENHAKPSTTNGLISKSNIEKKTSASTPAKSSIAKSSPVKPNATINKPIGLVDSKKPQTKEINKENLDKDLIAKDNEEEKKKKKKLLLIIFFIILGIALIALAIFFITRIPEKEINFTIIIDSDVTTTFEDEFGQIQHIKYMPGDLIDGYLKIKIENAASSSPSGSVFMRVKIGIEVDDNYYPGLFAPYYLSQSDSDKWYGKGAGDGEESPDNYLYYCHKCYDNTEIIAFNHLEFITNAYNNVVNGKSGKLIFTVEILKGNYSAISQEWYTAPDEWREIVR